MTATVIFSIRVRTDTDDCRPTCRNLARTDRDIDHVKKQATRLAATTADPLAPGIRHQRDRHELHRLEALIRSHEQGIRSS
jgi:hypothetical protein